MASELHFKVYIVLMDWETRKAADLLPEINLNTLFDREKKERVYDSMEAGFTAFSYGRQCPSENPFTIEALLLEQTPDIHVL